MLVPDPVWKKHTIVSLVCRRPANMAIGQVHRRDTAADGLPRGFAGARRTTTKPTLIHDPNRPPCTRSPLIWRRPIPARSTAWRVASRGHRAQPVRAEDAHPGVAHGRQNRTAQTTRDGKQINIAWFVCFAPVEDPQIAIAVASEGENPGESYAGGLYAAPVRQRAPGVVRKKPAPARRQRCRQRD